MSSPVSYDLQGQGGGQVLATSQATVATNVRWVQCLTDCVFSNISASNLADASDITNASIPAGVGFGGRIESITLSTGLAIAYYL
jgi:hypothetical protein